MKKRKEKFLLPKIWEEYIKILIQNQRKEHYKYLLSFMMRLMNKMNILVKNQVKRVMMVMMIVIQILQQLIRIIYN